MYALTSYINADPEARAWLNGKPDPWGMKVNPNYRKIALPVNNWPLLDSFEPLDEYQPGRIDCLYANPVPWLPLVAAPTARLANIAQDMQFAIAQTQTTCVLPSPIPGSLAGAKMVASGRESAGNRTMFGVVSLGDAQRDGLSLASLETTSSVSPAKQITDGSGRTFVAPGDASLRAAGKSLVPDRKTGTWTVPYSSLRTSSADAGAYPGTMPVYAAIPTEGLNRTDAKDFGEFLTFAAGEGQRSGSKAGDLPAGYLPMTAANGLGSLADYTSCAARAVAAQQGTVPLVTQNRCPITAGQTSPTQSGPPANSGTGNTARNPGGNTTGGDTTGGDTTTGGTGGGGTTGGNITGTGTTGGTTTPNSKAPGTTHSPSTTPGSVAASPVAATTPSIGAGVTGLALPLLFAIAILGGVGALVTRMSSGKRSGR